MRVVDSNKINVIDISYKNCERLISSYIEEDIFTFSKEHLTLKKNNGF